jgi:hypothetical protein
MDNHEMFEMYEDIYDEDRLPLACLPQFRAEGLNVIVPDMNL